MATRLLVVAMTGCFLCVQATGEGFHTTTAPSPTADVTVDLSSTEGISVFPHTWKRCFGSGHAALGLRDDWLQQATQATKDLGMQGIRQHGLFDDDMNIVTKLNPPVYNFTLLDKLWDRFVALKLKPVIELSFMPSILANCSWLGPHNGSCHDSITGPCHSIRDGCSDGKGGVRPGCKICSTGMMYGAVEQHPTDYQEWYNLVYAVVSHGVKRYGLSELQQWHFEVWNELWGFGDSTPPCKKPPCIGMNYMSLYNASARAIKAVHPSLKVGGPATEHLNVENFLSQAREMGNIPVDFVSSHNYPTGPRSDHSGCPQQGSWDPDCFRDKVMEAIESVKPHPFYLTEYSVMVGEGMAFNDRQGEPPFQHDRSGAAAFIFRVVPELSQSLDVMSYWTFSDVFEENAIPKSEFHNPTKYHQPHYGAMTLHGVPQPVWRAFQLLNEHAGTHLVRTSTKNSATFFNGSKGQLNLISAATTANITSSRSAVQPDVGTIVDKSSVRMFLSHWDASGDETITDYHPAVNVSLRVKIANTGLGSSSTCTGRSWIINNGTQARNEWVKQGLPDVPSQEEIQKLIDASNYLMGQIFWKVEDQDSPVSVSNSVDVVTLSGHVMMPPNSAVVLGLC